MLKTRDKPCARCCHSSHPAHNHETRLNTASAKSRRDKTSLTGRLHRLSKGVFKHQPLWGLAGLLHANAPMTTYESREIKGWRTRRDEEGERLASDYWGAPSRTRYHAGTITADGERLLGHIPWFYRVHGPEREAAKAHWAAHRAERTRQDKAEETDDQSEQRRERQRRWRAQLTPAQIERYKASALARLAKQTPEWRAAELEKRRQRKNANREQYNETDRLSAKLRSGTRNERKRAAYAANPELFRARERARRTANPEHVRALARAAYARRESASREAG